MSTKYYLCGPMSNIPQFNYPAFISAASDLRSRGLDITSPAELDSPKMRKLAMASTDGNVAALTVKAKETWGDVLARDVKMVADDLDAIIVLPGWENSRGANLELFVAILCNKTIYRYAPKSKAGIKPLSSFEVMATICDVRIGALTKAA